MRNKILTILGIIIFLGFSYIGISNIRSTNNKLEFKKIEVKSQEVKLKQLDEQYNQVLQQKANTEQEKIDQAEKIKQLEQEKQKLEEQLSVKLEKQRQAEIAKVKLDKEAKQVAGTGAANASPIYIGNCNTGNKYKDFIYHKESSCNPNAVNSLGCRGIGQACPGKKLPCGNDFACQDAWFSNYAIQRYGSWENAYNFWIANNWW